MTLSHFFSVSVSRRSLLQLRLAPCLLPDTTARMRGFLLASGNARSYPELIIVSWLFWQLCIEIKSNPSFES